MKHPKAKDKIPGLNTLERKAEYLYRTSKERIQEGRQKTSIEHLKKEN
jgi:hypothetical protein